MDIRPLTPDYSVSPQIAPEDLAAIRDAGFVAVIDNRPDGEIPPPLHGDAMRVAAEAAGLAFHALPVTPGDFNPALVLQQRETLEAAGGPVLAYCHSGTRSTIVWMLGQAVDTPADTLLETAGAAGYDLGQLRPHLEARFTG